MSTPVFLPHETFKNPNSDCVGVESRRGRGAGPELVYPPTTPIPHARPAWGKYVVCECHPSALSALTQIVPNLSPLYTLFYSVIFNSVVSTDPDLRTFVSIFSPWMQICIFDLLDPKPESGTGNTGNINHDK